MTDEEGSLVWSRVFDVFGKYLEHTPTYGMYGHSKPITQQFEQPLRFQGQYFDEETGFTIIPLGTTILTLGDLPNKTH